MDSFFKTFGKGILYFLLLPFMIIGLVIYGIYLFFVFIVYIFKTLVYFFKGKKFEVKDDLDEQAYEILKARKSEQLATQMSTTNTVNNTYNTINVTPDAFRQMQQQQNNQQIPQNNPDQLNMNEPNYIGYKQNNETEENLVKEDNNNESTY